MGTVRLGIGGTSGTNGALDITGRAFLDGKLSVFTTNGFTPLVGETYPLVSFAARTGTFATLHDEDLGDGVSYSPIHASTDISLSVIAA